MICLTDIGRVRVARIFKQLVSKIESLEAGLSASERDVIELFLTQLRDILEEEATTIHLDPPQVTDKFNAK